MTAHRKLALAALAGTAPLLFTALAAAPASAHGAPVNPVSRAAACGTEGGANAQSAACRAAVATSGTEAVERWDNLRRPNVNGRDRDVIPDGRLCSAGLDTYRGLDLPRTDWPATTLAAGAGYTFTYRGTIPHQGTFRLYVTRHGYQPTQPLTWADLEQAPFLTVTDPTLRKGSYTFAGTLPQGKTGRHVIYTIWQNSDTPDTYYSCSDVDFRAPAGGTDNAAAPDAGGAQAALSPPDARPAVAERKARIHRQSFAVPLLAGMGAVLVVLAAVALVRRRQA